MPPMWQYLCAPRKPDQSIAATKGTDPGPRGFFPANQPFSEGRRKGPRSPSWTPTQADAVLVDEGHAPVMAVLVPAVKTQARMLPPKARFPLSGDEEEAYIGR